jgi:inositol phosphorylceramide mannosyltransferase catalytic subunit
MIPKIIHQTVANKKEMHPAYLQNVDILKRMNPWWEHRLYDDEECRQFIEENAPEILEYYDSINPEYGPAKSDIFRYVVVYHVGGVYLDIKSTITRPLDEVLLKDDEYILAHWDEKKNPYAGRYRELGHVKEFQQWHVIAKKNHPFLKEVLNLVVNKIKNYSVGVGKPGVLRLTGPIAYTQAIQNVKDQHKYRLVDDIGLEYSVFKDKQEHKQYSRNHYSNLRSPIVMEKIVKRITICTQWTSEISSYAEDTELNHRAYAQKHNYGYYPCRFNPAINRPASWGKLLVLMSQFKTNDWLFWIDADAVFTNMDKKIEDFITNKDFIVGSNFEGINCGAFLISTSQWSQMWLKRLYDMTDYIENPWWEQAAIIHSMKDEAVQQRSLILGPREMQSFHWDWQPGDFIFHTPGIELVAKIKLLKEKM